MRHRSFAALGFLVVVLPPAVSEAHISIASGPAFANTSQEVIFSVGHGCEGMDTYRVDVEIPREVASVRPETSDFGQVNVLTDDAGSIVMVSWQKADSALLPADTQFYKLLVRLKAPDAPFTTVYFPAHQICKAPDGTTTVVDWVALDKTHPDVEPAPALRVLPPRFPGWNKFSVPSRLDALADFFSDAQIVWEGSAAFSINPTTADLIGQTEGVTALTEVPAGRQIWVRY